MSYDFSRFSPQSFERFIQALAAESVGPTVRIFGSGRDGAREASFEGKADFGGVARDGYMVFQAKHRQHPGTSTQNAKWLIEQIDAELAKFADTKRNLRVPDYYFIASNVRLSAAAADARGKGEGGIDKVTRHLEAAAKAAGIKEAILWHADTLSALLDIHEQVRTLFEFFVQPGDVLAAYMRKIDGPGDEEVLIPYLRHSLRQAREIKTRDIGQAIGRTVMLEEVFVDLPIKQNEPSLQHLQPNFVQEKLFDSPDDDETWIDSIRFDDDIFDRATIVKELMRRSAVRFDENMVVERNRRVPRQSMSNRIVLLGGPGQGKSTVGQFFAQLCRARLLDTLHATQSPETSEAVRAVLRCAAAEGVTMIGPPRYPFHVELPRYADALSSAERGDHRLSILAHIAQDIGKAADTNIDGATLRKWLSALPTVIILDGLDEVPRSGNRDALIKEIEDLLDTLHSIDADCLLFCTSRPQGYQDELARERWAHWTLEPLAASSALRLAERVSGVLVSEETRRDEIIAALEAAASEQTTAPLMTSPLQVMLLFQLVATHQNIPKDRWALFHQHYETLRNREIAKGGVTGAKIGEYRSQIDNIHRDVGYLLHLRAEGAGGANAHLTYAEFTDIVTRQLRMDGYDEDAETLALEIAHLATNRLVFLRSQVDGQVAFDVRSLQEFMAAARLTSSPEDLIRERLAAIAGRAHWLHVFKIACSKIFSSNENAALRQPLIGLFDSLDEGDRCNDDRLLRSGARHALQILTDGAASGLPLYRRQLITRTLRLLGSRDTNIFWEIARVVDFRERSFLEPLLREAAASPDDDTRLNALRLLLFANRYRDAEVAGWTHPLLDAHWPADGEDILKLVNTISLIPTDEDLRARLRQAQWSESPSRVAKWISDLYSDDEDDEDDEDSSNEALISSASPYVTGAPMIDASGASTDVKLRFISIGRAQQVYNAPGAGAHPLWVPAKAAADFAAAPSIDRAVHFIRAVQPLQGEPLDFQLPWPLRGLLSQLRRTGDHDALIRDLEAGAFGSAQDWSVAEQRWDVAGLSAEDLAASIEGEPMRQDWRIASAPLIASHAMNGDGEAATGALLELIDRVPRSRWAQYLLLHYIFRGTGTVEPDVLKFLVAFDPGKPSPEPVWWRVYAGALAVANAQIDLTPLFARLVDALPNVDRPSFDAAGIRSRLVEQFVANESQRYLLPAITAKISLSHTEEPLPLPVSAFELREGDSGAVRAAVMTLRIVHGHDGALKPAAIQAWLDAPPLHMSSMLLELSRGRRGTIGNDIAVAFCRAALTARIANLVDRCHDRLTAIAEARPVVFSDDEEAQRLELPVRLPDRVREDQKG